MGGVSWLTRGREIENYISPEAFRTLYPKTTKPLGRFEDIFDYLEEIATRALAKKFSRNKIGFAVNVLPHLKLEDLTKVHDWKQKMEEVVTKVRYWNKNPDV